jgi:type III restriction enzyme
MWRSEYIVPVPPPRHITQGVLDLDDEYGKRRPNDIVNDIRARVAVWRHNGHPGVTPATRRLLEHWNSPDRTRRLFFCQIEAAETAIWLAEAAPRADMERLRAMNPVLPRIALKLATGAGKTTVMAMLIAWQTLNAGGNTQRFTDRFLIIAPGITVRDRLRVLLPADPNNTYTLHDIVPLELRERLQRAHRHHELPRVQGARDDGGAAPYQGNPRWPRRSSVHARNRGRDDPARLQGTAGRAAHPRAQR